MNSTLGKLRMRLTSSFMLRACATQAGGIGSPCSTTRSAAMAAALSAESAFSTRSAKKLTALSAVTARATARSRMRSPVCCMV